MKKQTLVKLATTLTIGILVRAKILQQHHCSSTDPEAGVTHTQTGCLAVGMAVLTEHAIQLKNEQVRGIIHDGRPLGVLRGALFHIALSIVLTLAGLAMVRILGILVASQGQLIAAMSAAVSPTLFIPGPPEAAAPGQACSS